MKARHPLAPLTVGETAAATRLALDACPGARLVYCALREPARETVLGWDGGAVPRLARCVLYDRAARMTWLVTAALDTRVVTSRVPVPGVQPPIMAEEWAGNADQIKADPRFRAALARRGVTDLSQLQVDPWPAGNFGLEVDRSGRRLARGVAYVLDGPGSNPYARPVENLVAVLDRDTGEVIELIDGEVVPIPADPGRYDAAEVRRSRRMVVSFIANVGNYDYGFFWYFYLDGTIQAEVKLTGIIQTQATGRGARVPYASPVTPELAGPHHQHLFCFRLDPCVDGPANSVYEVDAIGVPSGPGNPYGNAFTYRATLLETEATAQRLAAADRARYWKIVNHASLNACGEPVAYTLLPQPSAPLLAQDTAPITARATFATRHLWVTPARPDERRPAGEFPNQSPGGDVLPTWTAADRPVTDTAIVVWHTVGTTHFCRPEDFPVMPVEYVGFTLKPFGFFDRNPALDLAPPGHCHA